MNNEYGLSMARDRGGDFGGIDVASQRINVNKDWFGPGEHNAVGSGGKRSGSGDYFVPWADVQSF